MFRIIGGDGKEYGPLSAEQVRQWISEKRVDARTKVVREGTADWTTIGQLQEFQMSPPVVQAETDGKAIGSLVCGILSFSMVPGLAAIPAIVLGHMSRASIRKSMGRLQGRGMALAGLIMGYVNLAIIFFFLLIVVAIFIPNLLRSRQAANESAAVANLRTINTAEVTYLSASGGNYGDIEALINAGLLDPRFHGNISGYTFSIIADGGEYVAEAVPASSNTGRFGYYSTPDGVVRFSTDRNLAPEGMTGFPEDALSR